MKNKMLLLVSVVLVISVVACGVTPVRSLPSLTPTLLPTNTLYPPGPTLTPYPSEATFTPLSTFTLYPTQVPNPTNTNYPPEASLTPWPTSTRYPLQATLTPLPTQAPYPKVTLCTGAGVSAYRQEASQILDAFNALNERYGQNPKSTGSYLDEITHLLSATKALNPPPLFIGFHLLLLNKEEAFLNIQEHGITPATEVSSSASVQIPNYAGDLVTEWGLISDYCNW